MAFVKTIIVIGGAHGGPSAAARARQVNENARIILVEKAPFVTWVQANLRYYLIGNEKDILKTIEKKENYFASRYNIEVLTNTTALSLDLDAKALLVQKGQKQIRLAFDSLVYAGGAISKDPNIEGLYGERVCNFRSLLDIRAIKKAHKEGAKTAVVIGAGFYGCEASIALKHLGVNVTTIEAKSRIMPRFSLPFAKSIYDELSEQGISIKLNTTIKKAEQNEKKGFLLTLSNNEQINTDLVVVCVGIDPRSGLLSNAGAALDPEGQVRVDDSMATTLPDVFACGSVVSVPHAITNERKWLPQSSIALRTAHIAGANAASMKAELHDYITPFCGTFITQVGNKVFARAGLMEGEARTLFGDNTILVTTVFGSASESWYSKKEMCVRLILNRKTRTIIGGEVYGINGVERRIDLISVAILEKWTPEKIISLDMAYIADSGPIFDPLKDAAYRASICLNNRTKAMSADDLALWLKSNKDFRILDVGEGPLLTLRKTKKVKHIPLERLRDRINELQDDDSPIVLYSHSGFRSYLAQQALVQRGLDNVYHLDGGAQSLKLIIE